MNTAVALRGVMSSVQRSPLHKNSLFVMHRLSLHCHNHEIPLVQICDFDREHGPEEQDYRNMKHVYALTFEDCAVSAMFKLPP